VFISIVSVSVSDAIVKLGEGIIVYVKNMIQKLFNNLSNMGDGRRTESRGRDP